MTQRLVVTVKRQRSVDPHNYDSWILLINGCEVSSHFDSCNLDFWAERIQAALDEAHAVTEVTP